MLMGFWAREVGTQPRMQLTQMLVPPADLTQRWPDWRRCGMLRGLHAVLAFDEGYQSEGLQLLAWHIEARNARSGCGSRELSQEDSRDNSSFSKCNCSAWTLRGPRTTPDGYASTDCVRQARPEEVSTDSVRQAGRKESPNSDQAADEHDHQWWHPERVFKRRKSASSNSSASPLFVVRKCSHRV